MHASLHPVQWRTLFVPRCGLGTEEGGSTDRLRRLEAAQRNRTAQCMARNQHGVGCSGSHKAQQGSEHSIAVVAATDRLESSNAFCSPSFSSRPVILLPSSQFPSFQNGSRALPRFQYCGPDSVALGLHRPGTGYAKFACPAPPSVRFALPS